MIKTEITKLPSGFAWGYGWKKTTCEEIDDDIAHVSMGLKDHGMKMARRFRKNQKLEALNGKAV